MKDLFLDQADCGKQGVPKQPGVIHQRMTGTHCRPDKSTATDSAKTGVTLLAAFLSLLVFLSGCAIHRERTLAIVDGTRITEGDLEYALTIAHRREDLSSADALNVPRYVKKLIDDQLIIEETYRMGLDQHPGIQEAVQAYILRESVVRLHEEEITRKVSVTEEEIYRYYKENYERFSVKSIEAGSEEKARNILEELKKGRSFEELIEEHAPHHYRGRSEAVYIRKSLMRSPSFGEAVLALKPDEVSDVIRVQAKYYIVKLLKREEAPEEAFEKARKSVQAAVRKEKEKKRSDEYLSQLREMAEITVNTELFSEIDPEGGKEALGKWSLDERIVASVYDSALRVKDFITMLKPGLSKDAVLDRWIDLELVDHEALRRRYEENTGLGDMARRYRNQLLKNTFIRSVILPQIGTSEEKLREYYVKTRQNYLKPVRYKFQQITVMTMEEAEEIVKNLEGGADFSWLARMKSLDGMSQESGVIGWQTRSQLIGPLRDIADTLTVGEISPIFEAGSHFRIFRLAAKSREEFRDFDEVRDAVSRAYVDEELKKLLDEYVAQLKAVAEIEINERAVRSLEEEFYK